MNCPRCENDNPRGSNFCLCCGARLGVACTTCGNDLPAAARFCNRCGAAVGDDSDRQPKLGSHESYTPPPHLAEKILTSRIAVEGERKQVTVLFADMKGSMELVADRDPEEARAIVDPILQHMMDAVHRYEGTVNQVMGDGIMALFGAPLAHEDHAVRACYAALRMQETIRRYGQGIRQRKGVLPQIRVGVNSGEVVVRSIGSDLRMDYTAVGHATHLAARVEQAAGPGSTLITAATLRLTRGYVETRPLGPISVKGATEPVEVHELTGVAASRSRLDVHGGRGLTRFVGRQAEIERLGSALEQARGGRGQVVATVGEPGIGKSRLLRELARSERAQGCLILEAASVSYGKGTSYLPVIELLRDYFQIDALDEPRKARERVTGRLLALDRALEAALPAILALLDLPTEDAGWIRLEPPERRRRTVEGVTHLLLRETLEQPLVIVFEDLHWIDAETQAVLDGLVEGLPGAPLLLLVSYRPEYQHGWGNKTYYMQLRVDPLPPTSADELLNAVLGADAELDGLRRLLVERTEGNPFFLEESVLTLVETGALAGERGAYRLTQPVDVLDVPARVHAVLAARIDRLAVEDKRLLQAAAVIGHDVPFALLQAIAELTGADLQRALARLRAAEFLYETNLFPDLSYSFKHALTHEVAYGTMLHGRRRELHARIVDVIERLHADRLAEHVERLAHHAVRGEAWEKALRYLREAGRRAAFRSAFREAVAAFEEALRVLSHLPATPEVAEMAIDVRLDSRSAFVPLGQYDRLLEHMQEAERLARTLGDRRRLGLVLADMGARFRNVGEHRRAREASRQALDIASELGDLRLRFEATYRLAQAHFAVGDLAQAIALFVETMDVVGDRRAVTATAEPTSGAGVAEQTALPSFLPAWPRAWLALALSHLGRFEEAFAHAEEARRIAERAGHPHTIIEACGAFAEVGLRRGELDTAARMFERGVEALRAHGARDANVLSGLGYAYALRGRLADGLPLLEDSVQDETSVHAMGLGLTVRMSRLAHAYLLAGRAGEALDRARTAVELARKHGERANLAEALRGLADIAAGGTSVEASGATTLYAESFALAEELGMRPLVAHCHLGLGKHYARAGKRHEMQEQLTAAAAMYRAMGMGFWLDQAVMA